MDPDRPPDLDADYRLIHGPWPRWMMHLGLVKLALRTGAVVGLCMLLFLGAILLAHAVLN
jgi:hypothetical protein